jgi:hypothetical protein
MPMVFAVLLSYVCCISTAQLIVSNSIHSRWQVSLQVFELSANIGVFPPKLRPSGSEQELLRRR